MTRPTTTVLTATLLALLACVPARAQVTSRDATPEGAAYADAFRRVHNAACAAFEGQLGPTAYVIVPAPGEGLTTTLSVRLSAPDPDPATWEAAMLAQVDAAVTRLLLRARGGYSRMGEPAGVRSPGAADAVWCQYPGFILQGKHTTSSVLGVAHRRNVTLLVRVGP